MHALEDAAIAVQLGELSRQTEARAMRHREWQGFPAAAFDADVSGVTLHAPMPDDHAHALAAREASRQAQLASAEPQERNAALFGIGAMSSAFTRIEQALELRRERESARQTESMQESNL